MRIILLSAYTIHEIRFDDMHKLLTIHKKKGPTNVHCGTPQHMFCTFEFLGAIYFGAGERNTSQCETDCLESKSTNLVRYQRGRNLSIAGVSLTFMNVRVFFFFWGGGSIIVVFRTFFE